MSSDGAITVAGLTLTFDGKVRALEGVVQARRLKF